MQRFGLSQNSIALVRFIPKDECVPFMRSSLRFSNYTNYRNIMIKLCDYDAFKTFQLVIIQKVKVKNFLESNPRRS